MERLFGLHEGKSLYTLKVRTPHVAMESRTTQKCEGCARKYRPDVRDAPAFVLVSHSMVSNGVRWRKLQDIPWIDEL